MSEIEVLMDKTQMLLDKLVDESGTLDELQKAQVVQALLHAKIKLAALVEKNTVPKELAVNILELFKAIDRQAQTVDLPKVQAALEHLSEGIGELIKQKDTNTVVKE